MHFTLISLNTNPIHLIIMENVEGGNMEVRNRSDKRIDFKK